MPFRMTVTMKAIWMRFNVGCFHDSLLNAMSGITRFMRGRSQEARFGQVMNRHRITGEAKHRRSKNHGFSMICSHQYDMFANVHG